MKKYLLALYIFVSLFGGSVAYAQTKAANVGYVPLEPIPGVTASNGTYDPTAPGQFVQIVNALFKILITAGALLAVLSLTIGGVQYMTSSSAGNKTAGIDRAKAAMWGILLIAGIWLILNTINPQLLNFNFNPCPVNSSVCTSIAGSSVFNNTTNNNTNGATPNDVDGYANAINNKPVDAEACSNISAAAGTTNISSVSDFTTTISQMARVAHAALFENNVFDPTPLSTQISKASADTYNKLITADQNYVSRCQAAGLL